MDSRSRLGLTVLNALCAGVSLGVGVFVLWIRSAEAPRVPVPIEAVPIAFAASDEPIALSLGPGEPTPPASSSSVEDARALFDPLEEFARECRVVLATVDGEAKSRSCIVAHPGGQLTLVPGECVRGFLLVSILPQPGRPRTVRLRFRDVRRGAELDLLLRSEN